MKYIIFFLISTFSLFGQTGYKTASLDNNGKELWDIAKPDIANSGYKYYIRYEYFNQIVNLYANDSLHFKGQVISYLTEQKDNKTSNFVYDVSEIPQESCTIVSNKILTEKLYNLPIDDSIPGYNKYWMDCPAIDFTIKIDSKIIRKEYACLRHQKDTVPHVKILKENYTIIDSLLQLKSINKIFESKLRGGSNYGNGYVGMYKLTEKEKAAWDNGKPRRKYLESKKDTIDNAIEAYIIANYKNEGDCYNEFTLDFNKKGKVVKISTDTPFWERLFDKDYHHCRRNVKKLFRRFNLKEMDLKYGFTRDLNFGLDDKPYIYDRTLY